MLNVYISKGDRQWGPYPSSQVPGLVERGSFGPEDWAWIEGGNEWVPLGSVLGMMKAEVNAEAELMHEEVERARAYWRSKLTTPVPGTRRPRKATQPIEVACEEEPVAAVSSMAGVAQAAQTKSHGRTIFFSLLGVGTAAFVALFIISGNQDSGPSRSITPPVRATLPMDETQYQELTFKGDVAYHPESNVPFEGRAVMRHHNGKLMYEANYVAGKRNGRVASYYENGQVLNEGTMVEGKLDGSFTQYHADGQMKSREAYQDGLVMNSAPSEVTLKKREVIGRQR